MKQFITALVVVIFSACGSSTTKFTPKTDTLQVIARQQQGDAIFIDSAVLQVTRKRKFKNDDSTNLDGVLSIDSAFYLSQPVDTLRDSLRHPIYGPNKAVRFRYAYSQTPVADTLNKYIQIVNIPSWKKKN